MFMLWEERPENYHSRFTLRASDMHCNDYDISREARMASPFRKSCMYLQTHLLTALCSGGTVCCSDHEILIAQSYTRPRAQ